MNFQIVYLPIGVTAFDLYSAQMMFEDTREALCRLDKNIICPDGMLLGVDKVNEFLEDKSPDLLIVQNITFANSVYISEIVGRYACPVLLWSLPEPASDGTRLRLNSLSGAFAAGNAMKHYGKRFEYLHGSVIDDKAMKRLASVMNAAKLKASLRRLNLLQVGSAPEGFSFGTGVDNDLFDTFGVRLHTVEARAFMEAARAYSDDDIRDFIFDAQNLMPNILNIEQRNFYDVGRLFKAYIDYCTKNNIGAVASRCRPDFFTVYGTPVCVVLSLLNDFGIPAACEADTYGALSVYICQYLAKLPSFFGEPVCVDEANNDITFWHCGMAPLSLASERTGAMVGVHCNRGIGPTLDFGCRGAGRATVFRVGRKPDGGFRFFISTGDAPERAKQYTGTTIVIKTDNPVKSIVENAVKGGWEPHFAIAMADVSYELEVLANMLGIDVERF